MHRWSRRKEPKEMVLRLEMKRPSRKEMESEKMKRRETRIDRSREASVAPIETPEISSSPPGGKGSDASWAQFIAWLGFGRVRCSEPAEPLRRPVQGSSFEEPFDEGIFLKTKNQIYFLVKKL